MPFVSEAEELQRLFAQTDSMTESSHSSNPGRTEILLAKRKNMKLKMHREACHSLPVSLDVC